MYFLLVQVLLVQRRQLVGFLIEFNQVVPWETRVNVVVSFCKSVTMVFEKRGSENRRKLIDSEKVEESMGWRFLCCKATITTQIMSK